MQRLAVLSILLCLFLLAGCAQSPLSAAPSSSSSIILVTSFTPVDQFVSAVAGSDAQVIMLIPPGAEPHDFEPSPSDAKALADAKAKLKELQAI